MKKTSLISYCIIALVAFAAWAPNASAFTFFSDSEGAGPSCEDCHPALANFGPGHSAHAEPTNSDCNLCHAGGQGGRNSPPLANCTICHGRDADAGGDGISAGLGRGLRLHHQNAEVADCALCHSDAIGPVGAPESTPPSYYPGPNVNAQLDPCDGSEERFASNSVSLDNDGDLLTDGADPDCVGPVCGDGTLDPGEECDDGNTVPGDGCDENCMLEPVPCVGSLTTVTIRGGGQRPAPGFTDHQIEIQFNVLSGGGITAASANAIQACRDTVLSYDTTVDTDANAIAPTDLTIDGVAAGFTGQVTVGIDGKIIVTNKPNGSDTDRVRLVPVD